MAGTFIEVKVEGMDALAKALTQLARQGRDMASLYKDIGEYLLTAHKTRFDNEISPEGAPWEALSDTTLSRKSRTDKVLREEGTLADTLAYQLGLNGLNFGSNEEYAAMHQFGGTTSPQSMFPNKPIPARPFLGVSDSEREDIIEMVESHLVLGLS